MIVGGGFSLYLKTRFLKKSRSPRYTSQPFIRSTKDIDVFLTSEIIIDPVAIENIKSVLFRLDFKVKTEYFQYIKEIQFGDEKKEVLLDLLSQPVQVNDLDKVKIKRPRIKPIDVEEFHAFYHEEAEVINKNLIKLEGLVDSSLKNKFKNVYLLSAFSFIILKLHAFRDRINDEKKDYGRYHAYDIFSSIIEMDENDWKVSKSQFELFKMSSAVSEAIRLINKFFSTELFMGIIRLKENQLYKRNQNEYDSYLKSFIEDIKELFQIT